MAELTNDLIDYTQQGKGRVLFGRTSGGDYYPVLIDQTTGAITASISGDVTVDTVGTITNDVTVDTVGTITNDVTVDTVGTITNPVTSNIYGYNGTNYHPVGIDSITRVLSTIDYPHHEMHAGSYFFVKSFVDVSVANTDFLLVVPNTTKWPHTQWTIATEGEFELYVYEDVSTSADGTPVTINNANRNSGTTAGVTFFSGPTLAGGTLGDGSQGGDLLWAGKVGSGKNATESRNTGFEEILKQNTKYWMRAVKIAAGTLWMDYDLNWYEHTNKAT